MSEHVGYVVKINSLRPHSNADRLQIATIFDSNVIVSLDTHLDDIGVYFPSDIQLSEEFCKVNDLVRRKDENGNPAGGYLDPNKRNIRPLKLRGEKSDGLYLPITCMMEFCPISDLKVGDTIGVINGHEICKKYIPRGRNSNNSAKGKGNKTRKKHVPVAPLFTEHADTEQLVYNLGAFKPGDEIEITLKMHGTSQRTAYLPILKGYKRTIWDKLFGREGTPIYDWGYVSGTRRTVLDDWDGGFYGSNAFRKQHQDKFVGKLHKGEEVYYEVVGFTDSGTPIMSKGNNKKLDKDFVKQYGEETVFSYGCSPNGLGEPVEYWDEAKTRPAICPKVPQSDLYVYRMTMTNEDGDVVEYSPDFMRYRCEQMGVKCVPEFVHVVLPDASYFDENHTAGNYVKEMAEQYYDGPDPIGKTHVREGVVVRIINRPQFCAYKTKNYSFKMLEGLIKESAAAPDMEEAEEVNGEN